MTFSFFGLTAWFQFSEPRNEEDQERTGPSTTTISDASDRYHSSDTQERQQHLQDSQAVDDKDYCYIRVARPSHTPSTPEGLRPRQRTSKISAELGLVSSTAATDPLEFPGTVVTNEQNPPPQQQQQAFAVLPPRQKTSSWLTQGVHFSPPVSTSSFYASSRDGTEDIAESPHLMPGQARTAVGAAIVAFQQQQEDHQQECVAEQEENHPVHSDWDEITSRQDTVAEDDDENEQPGYHELNTTQDDPITNARSPFRLTGAEANSNRLLASPISTSSSLLGSPSSRAKNKDTSYESSEEPRRRLISQQQQHAYDFAPLLPHKVAWTDQQQDNNDEDCNNLSAITEDCHQRKSTSRKVLAHDDKYVPNEQQKQETFYPQLDSALLQVKSQNQRRYKEQLIMAALNRLQDDLEVISDVEEVAGAGVSNEWLVKTPLNEEGILSGFSHEKRMSISGSLTKILNTMDTARPEVFFLKSPTETAQLEDTHDDLRDALLFARRLVESAVADKPVRYWKFRRSTVNLGVIPPAPASPAARGGDTSLFSLPSDSMAETPMTSNVSLTTTITSAVSPRGMHGGNKSVTSLTPDGLVVRRTIEILTTVLNQITCACKDLVGNDKDDWSLSAQESIRVTENLKRSYLQLLAVQDLPSLIESFEEISDDGNIYGGNVTTKLMPRNHLVLPPPPPSFLFRSRGEESFCPEFTLPTNRPSFDHSIGSASGSSVISAPDTMDMGTTSGDYDVDDLRRQIGSNDYEDGVEERDGPVEI